MKYLLVRKAQRRQHAVHDGVEAAHADVEAAPPSAPSDGDPPQGGEQVSRRLVSLLRQLPNRLPYDR